MKNKKTERLVVSALLLAMGTVLSVLQIEMPFGGGLTIASMLPIIIISYRYGIGWGFLSSTVYAFGQILIGIKTIAKYVLPGDEQMNMWLVILMCLLDYVCAYLALALGGLFRKMKPVKALALGSLVATSTRFLFHFLSGFILWGEWASWFFSDEVSADFGAFVLAHFSGTGLAMIYSFIYNGMYMIPEIIITTLLAAAVAKIPVIANKFQSKLS